MVTPDLNFMVTPDLVHKFPALSDIPHIERKLPENCVLPISS